MASAHRSKSSSELNLSQIPAGATWLQEASDGSISIRTARMNGVFLTASSRAALALTELCCARGRGRVYCIAPVVPGAAEKEKQMIHASSAARAVPEVFYVPEPWSKEEQQGWSSMAPVDQLRRLTSRYGWIDGGAAVLPFAVEIFDEEKLHPILDGLKAARLTVLMGPFVYVGLTEDMRAKCDVVYHKTSTGAFMGRSFFGKNRENWDDFEKFQVSNCGAIVSTFDKIYRAQIPEITDCVVLYDALVESLILSAKEAAEAGEPFGSMD